MSTANTLSQAIKSSLARGSKMLVGSLGAAAAGHIVSLYCMLVVFGKTSQRDFDTPLGLALPGPIAAWVFLLISTLSGFGALLALRQARSTVVRIINQKKATSDDSWIGEIQSVLSGSSSITTNPTVIRTICFFAWSLQGGSLLYLLFTAKGIHTQLGFIMVFLVYGSVLVIPFILLIWNRWLVMFKPESYDKENISMIL